MDEKLLKTSITQRIWITVIAVLLLGSTIATYVAIVASSQNKGGSQSDLETQYSEKQNEISAYSETLSNKYFSDFVNTRSQVKAYNAEAANSKGVQKNDLKEGTGRELTTGDLNYFAYYIGFCADETVFDSSFNPSFEEPTSLKVPLYAGQGLIEGWNEGVVGMKLGGIREITMPGELAYGENREICGGLNSPLKFIVLALEEDDKLGTLNQELQNIYIQLMQNYSTSSQY